MSAMRSAREPNISRSGARSRLVLVVVDIRVELPPRWRDAPIGTDTANLYFVEQSRW